MRVPAKADPGLTLEQMKAFVRNHFNDFVNRKQSDAAQRNFSVDFLDHDEPSGPVVGPNAAKEMMGKAYQRWPDLHVEIEEILAEGDRVMVRNKWPATERSSGRRIEFHGFVLWRFANQTIVEPWATLTPSREL